MSQTETFLLPDGRKTSDLKVLELRKELDKLGKSKSGNKSELLNRLNESYFGCSGSASQIEKENSVSSESQVELNNSKQDEIEDNSQNDRRIVNIKKSSGVDVDLDASDDTQPDNTEVNQSVDALDLYIPIDDSLNIVDESIQDERIQVTISRNEKIELNCDEDNNGEDRRIVETITNDQRTVICASNDSEKEETIDMECIVDDSDIKGTRKVELEGNEESVNVDTEVIENEADEVENIELETQIEMYEVDNIDMDGPLEMYEDHKDEVAENSDKKEESIIANIEKDLRETEFLDVGTADETEEGEVVSVPITARLGKRKVKEENKTHSSPKKSKKKGLKETKGAGYIVEGPERIQPAQKSKNSMSDVLRIDNLVRPFTLIQLQDMLALQGVVKEVWLNKIKSVAYVRYEDESVANSARESIDGCRWPSINPKLLSCDFVSSKEMEWMKEKGDSGANPPSSYRQSQQEQKEQIKQSTHKEQSQTHGQGQQEQVKAAVENEWRPLDKPKTANREIHKSDKTEDAKKRVKDREVPTDNNKRRQRSPNPDHRRRHESPKEQRPRERIREKSKEKNPPPPAAKLLEDIFRKTVTQPAIYWLPVAKEKKEEPIKKVKEAVRVQ